MNNTEKTPLHKKKFGIKHLGYGGIGLVVLFMIIGMMGSSEDNKSRNLIVDSESNTQTRTAQQAPPKIISYSVLREWNPDRDSSALGLEILINEEDARPVNITNLVRNLSVGREKAVIKIYQDKKAWEESQAGEYTDVFNKGYLAFYVKNATGSGAYRGFNEIRWMQEGGELDSLFGSKIQL